MATGLEASTACYAHLTYETREPLVVFFGATKSKAFSVDVKTSMRIVGSVSGDKAV